MSSEARRPPRWRAGAALAGALLWVLISGPSCSTGVEDTCHAYARLLARSWADCKIMSYEVGEAILEEALRCADALGVLDESALRERCFTAMPKMSCDDLLAKRFPEACLSQFMYAEQLQSWVN